MPPAATKILTAQASAAEQNSTTTHNDIIKNYNNTINHLNNSNNNHNLYSNNNNNHNINGTLKLLTSSAATTNVGATITTTTPIKEQRSLSIQQQNGLFAQHTNDYKARLSVAEFVARQQQQLQQHHQHQQQQQQHHHFSDINDLNTTTTTELLNRSRLIAMPEVLNAAVAATNLVNANLTNNHNNNNNNNNNQHHLNSNNNKSNNNKINPNNNNKVNTTTPSALTMNNVRLASMSPTLSMNGSSNESTNVHSMSMYGPTSPQSSDSGQSMSDSISHKYNNGYDGHHKSSSGSGSMSAQAAAHHKELFSQRKQREFTPDNKKDESYWDRRRRNNEAAKRSREKRRYNDMILEQRVVELTKENHVLKAQLDAIKDKFNISGENLVSVEQILASLPTSEQVLSITKRAKISPSGFQGNGTPTPMAYTNGSSVNSSDNSDSMNESIALPAKSTTPHQQQPQQQQPPQSPVIKNNNPHINGAVSHSVSPAAHIQLPSSVPAHVPSASSHYHLQQQQQHQQPQQQPGQTQIDTYRTNSTSPVHAVVPAATAQIRPTAANVASLQNLHVLQSLNRNVNCDGLDSLRKVVAVVGAIKSTGADLPALYGSHAQPNPALYAAATQNEVPYPANYGKETLNARMHDVPYHTLHPVAGVESPIGSGITEPVASCSPDASSVLNLSRRACNSPAYDNMLSSNTPPSSRLSCSLSSASSSGVVSGDDEQEHDHDHDHEAVDDVDNHHVLQHRHHPRLHHHQSISISSTSPSSSDSNNCLPLKLRHKSHLGDKDAAATALLALQHIKQEPINHRSSPPSWTDGGDNSSDERDSGISIGSAEWTAQLQQRKLLNASNAMDVDVAESVNARGEEEAEPVNGKATASIDSMAADREHLKSKLALLESEVANIKNMMILTNEPTTATALKGKN